jgi:hypothetical protein
MLAPALSALLHRAASACCRTAREAPAQVDTLEWEILGKIAYKQRAPVGGRFPMLQSCCTPSACAGAGESAAASCASCGASNCRCRATGRWASQRVDARHSAHRACLVGIGRSGRVPLGEGLSQSLGRTACARPPGRGSRDRDPCLHIVVAGASVCKCAESLVGGGNNGCRSAGCTASGG